MSGMEKPQTNMEFKWLTDDTKIPVLGVGTWDMGGGMEPDTTHDREDIHAIKTAIKLGMTHIDTAEMYARGHTEELVGEAIKDFDRKELFITTKVLPENLRYDDVVAAAKRSLQRLKTTHIDLYLVHMPNPIIPIQQTMEAFDFLVESKLVRFIGVSNFTLEQLREAQAYTRNKIVANQIEYNLLMRDQKGEYTSHMESSIVPYCNDKGIMVVAYRPLAKGRLARSGYKVMDALSEKYHKTPVGDV